MRDRRQLDDPRAVEVPCDESTNTRMTLTQVNPGVPVGEVRYGGFRVIGVGVTDENVRFSVKTKVRRRRKTT